MTAAQRQENEKELAELEQLHRRALRRPKLAVERIQKSVIDVLTGLWPPDDGDDEPGK
jgi:hypothetical protein